MNFVKMMVFVPTLFSAMLLACGTNPGSVSITFAWEGEKPPEGLWIHGQVMQVNPDSEGTGQIISEMESPQEYGPGMNLSFPDIQNQENLAILLEARGDSSLESRVLYYGISDPFSLKAGKSKKVDAVVAMVETPDITNLAIEEAVGPEDCPDCYTSKETVTLNFNGVRATTVEVSNDNDFSVCNRTFQLDTPGQDAPKLVVGDDGWTIEGWSLDCELEDAADGPRNVYVRLLGDMGYPSQPLSVGVMLDRQPPTEPIINCVDGTWLIKLQTTMQFGVVNANEMWVEACESDPDNPGSCVAIEGGLQLCVPDNDNYISVESWTDFTTQGCIRFTDETITAVQVKYRDFAHNETDWVTFEFENVTELELTWMPIPGGTFEMGCSPGDTECSEDEFPVHPVTLSPFEMLETEVTESQYVAATGENPSCQKGTEGGDDFPVECVTWFQAKAFCETVGGRLPTEAEWEYAARGGTTTKYYCGDDLECLDEIAWYGSNSGTDGHKHQVGGKHPNVYGLYDMLGNVEEWTGDWYELYHQSPVPPQDPIGPQKGFGRVLRGAYFDTDVNLGVSKRQGWYPSSAEYFVGWRCVRSD